MSHIQACLSLLALVLFATVATASVPGLSAVSDAARSATSMVPSVPGVPGVGDMMSMASGGMETMVKMMIQMIDMSMVTSAIQKGAELMKMTLRSGLKLLDAKMYDVFGFKEFSKSAEDLAREAEMPEFLIASVMAFTAITSQALLSVAS